MTKNWIGIYDKSTKETILMRYIGKSKKIVLPKYLRKRKITHISNSLLEYADYEIACVDMRNANGLKISNNSLSHVRFLNGYDLLVVDLFVHGRIDDYYKRTSPIKDLIMPYDIEYTELFRIYARAERMNVPESVESIDSYEFMYTRIKELHVGTKVREIRSRAFKHATNLKTIIFPEDSMLRLIETKAFSGCVYLTHIDLPKGLKWLSKSVFEYTGIRELEIPKSVEQIHQSTFNNMPRDAKIIFEYSVAPIKVFTINSSSFDDNLFRGLYHTNIQHARSMLDIRALAYPSRNKYIKIDIAEELQSHLEDYGTLYNGICNVDQKIWISARTPIPMDTVLKSTWVEFYFEGQMPDIPQSSNVKWVSNVSEEAFDLLERV